MNNMQIIHQYWVYLVALGTILGFVINKGYEIWIEKNKKRQAYNRVFSAIIKTYYSYLKYKMFYSESSLKIPDEILLLIIKHTDNFKEDLDNFKSAAFAEAEIIPEITFKAHHLFDTLERLSVFDKFKASEDAPDLGFISESHELIIKRALLYALEEVFDNFFIDIIKEIKKHTPINKKFISRLLNLNTESYRVENELKQNKVYQRYRESLKKQGVEEDELGKLDDTLQ